MKTSIDPPSVVVGSDTRILCSRRYAPGSSARAKGFTSSGKLKILVMCETRVGVRISWEILYN